MSIPGNRCQYLSPRHGSNARALRNDVIAAWRRGDQLGVPPITMEWAPILACNADCPLCPFARSRHALCDGTIYPGEFAPPDDRTVASRTLAFRVLEAAAEAGVWGVLFTGGGEPTIWEPLWDALRHSTRLGMVNALYTNAFQLGRHPGLVEPLLDPASGLAFIRLSTGTAQIAAKLCSNTEWK